MASWQMAALSFAAGGFFCSSFTEKAKKQPIGQYVGLWLVLFLGSGILFDLGLLGRWVTLAIGGLGLALFGLSFKYRFRGLFK